MENANVIVVLCRPEIDRPLAIRLGRFISKLQEEAEFYVWGDKA